MKQWKYTIRKSLKMNVFYKITSQMKKGTTNLLWILQSRTECKNLNKNLIYEGLQQKELLNTQTSTESPHPHTDTHTADYACSLCVNQSPLLMLLSSYHKALWKLAARAQTIWLWVFISNQTDFCSTLVHQRYTLQKKYVKLL